MVMDFLASMLRIIVELIWIDLAYRIGGLVLRLASFGGVRAAPIDAPHSSFNRFWCRRGDDGAIEVEHTFAGGIGFLIFFAFLVMYLRFF